MLVIAVVLVWFQLDDLQQESLTCAVPDDCRYPLGEVVAPAAYGLRVVAVPLALLLPRAAVWAAALGAVLQACVAVPIAEGPNAAWLAAVVLTTAGLVEMAGRWRQRTQAQRWSSPAAAESTSGLTSASRTARAPWDEDTRRLALIVLLGALIIVVALIAWQQVQVRDLRTFEKKAHYVTVTVRDLPDDETIELQLDGRRERVERADDYTKGQQVPVLVDADNPHHVVLVGEPSDPSGLISWAVAVLAFAVGFSARLWARGWARMRLVRSPLPAVRLRVGRDGEVLVLTTLDDARFARPLAAVIDLEPVQALLASTPGEPHDRLDAGWGDEWEDEWEDEETLPAEFMAFAPAKDGGTPATVLGLRCDGSPVRILRGDDDLVSTPLVNPWLWRQQRRRLRERSGPLRQPPTAVERAATQAASGAPAAAHSPLSDARWASFASAVLPMLAPVGLPLAYLVAVLAGPATAIWLDGEASFGQLLRVLVNLGVGIVGFGLLTALRQPTLAQHPQGLLYATPYSRRVITRDRVDSVLAHRAGVMVRLVAPRESLLVAPQDLSAGAHRWDKGAPTPQHAKATIEAWLSAATPAEPKRAPRIRRWTTATPPATLLVASMLGAWLVTRLSG